jgi:hypothetical protein
MNGLNRSLGLVLALCVLVIVISVGLGIIYNPLRPQEESTGETSMYGREKTIVEVQEDREEGAHFQWMGHSLLSDTSVSLQIKYSGPTIEKFDEKGFDFLINGRQCKWYSRIVKGQGGQITVVEDGDTLYILVSFDCILKKGDTLTVQYLPLGFELTTQL